MVWESGFVAEITKNLLAEPKPHSVLYRGYLLAFGHISASIGGYKLFSDQGPVIVDKILNFSIYGLEERCRYTCCIVL